MHYREEFPQREGLIHLNHAGVSPWPRRSADAVKRFAEENVRHGSLHYARWLAVEAELREQLRSILNAPSRDDIALLKNTSEALSVVAYGLDWKAGDNIVSSNQEFPSNRIVWESLARRGVGFREADLNSAPRPEDALFSLVDSRTRLITVSSVQYATGLRMDLVRIGDFCRERRILFCVDAIQSLGAVRFDVQEIHADFVMADGHKWMLGPEGLAVFYSRPVSRDSLHLSQYGWHMVERAGDFEAREWQIAGTARRFECGSPNMLGIHALSASLSLLLEAGTDAIERAVTENSGYLFERLRALPELEIITPRDEKRYAGIVTFRHRDADAAALFHYLGGQGVLCAHRAGGIRFSPHFYTSRDHLDAAVDLVQKYTSSR